MLTFPTRVELWISLAHVRLDDILDCSNRWWWYQMLQGHVVI